MSKKEAHNSCFMPHFSLSWYLFLGLCCPSRNVNVLFQLAENVSLLCLRLGRGRRGDVGQHGARSHWDRRKYSISWVTPLFLGITKGLTGG